jgi:hypothetical protein
MIDGLVLVAILVPAMIVVVTMLIHVIKHDGGTKGITNEYTSKSGTKRTAKKSRQEHIV